MKSYLDILLDAAKQLTYFDGTISRHYLADNFRDIFSVHYSNRDVVNAFHKAIAEAVERGLMRKDADGELTMRGTR